MPKYYCDYCDTHLTHDSPSVRKTHCAGRKHKDNVKLYYTKWMEDQAQQLIDATTAAFKAGRIANNPFATSAGRGVAIPPPPLTALGQRPGASGASGMMAPGVASSGPIPPMMMRPQAPMPPMMYMGHPMMGMMPGRPMGPVANPPPPSQ